MSEINTAALPALATTQTQSWALRIPRRPLKIGAAATLAFAGLYAIFSEHEYVASSQALVSAYVLDVRAPMDGVLSRLPVSAGVPVRAGQTLGHLEAERVETQHLSDLLAEETAARADLAGLAAEQQSLQAQRAGLLARAGDHSLAVGARLEQAIAEAKRVLASDRLFEAEATTEMERSRKLHEAGILAAADFDKILSTQRIAVERTAAQEAELRSVEAQAAAARRGLLTEPGTNNDVAYSHQRADEVALRLAENARGLAAAQGHAQQLHEEAAAEQLRTSLLNTQDLHSPIDGMLWNLNAMDGERAATGDSVLTLVDCRREFLLVQIPQERVPDVVLRGQARIRLSGESVERVGTVVSVSPDLQKDVRHKLAVAPEIGTKGDLATVRVTLDPQLGDTPEACLVGRTARVLIPTTTSNNLARLTHRYF